MPQLDDSLLEELLQKLRDDDSEEDPLKYLLEKTLNQLLEKEMTCTVSAKMSGFWLKRYK